MVELLAKRCYNEAVGLRICLVPTCGYYILEAADGPTPVPRLSRSAHF
jgi:hypothetical protein